MNRLEVSSAPNGKLTGAQWRTLGLLFSGYMGYYFCRANLAVVSPLLQQESAGALTEQDIGILVSAGILSYFLGKLTTGPIGDLVDGKRMFLGGMVLSAGFSVGCGAGTGFFSLLCFWIGNRFVQSMGWSGLVKIASRWFPPTHYGMVFGVLSLSYQFGDSVAKFCLGSLLQEGWSWRGNFLISAGLLALVAVVIHRLLRTSPLEVGGAEPEVNPANAYGVRGQESRAENLGELLGPLMQRPAFWLVCLMSGGLTFIRETLNFWTPTYLSQVLHLEAGRASQYSAFLPLFGGVAAVLAGMGGDRWLQGRRGLLMALLLAALIAVLGTLSLVAETAELGLQLSLLSAATFFLTAPYSFLGGAMAVDLGARRGSATTAGLIDAAGYAVGSSSGIVIGSLARGRNWSAVFHCLIIAAGAACFAAVWYGLHYERNGTEPAPSEDRAV